MARPLRRVLVVVTVAAAAVLVWRFVIRPPVPRAAGPLPHAAYVWQRAWTGPVREAVTGAGAAPALGGLVVLGAEVAWEGGAPRVARVRPDADALRASGLPVGLALRIGPYAGPFAAGGEPFGLLARLAESLVAESAAAGVAPRELQVDFDCAESKLDGYRVWVEALRRRVAPVPLTFTALPSWLDAGAFRRLAAAADGFVLQVHSLERPAGPDAPLALCDPAAARRAVERAARAGVPFRVALPTYGYLVAFDRGGRFLGIAAEGPRPGWPDDARVREVGADAAAMAGLVRGWTADRPAALRGVIWYRLPVETDALNWRPATLDAVRAGRVPRAVLRAETRRPQPGLVEIDLVNDGDGDAALAGVSVTTRWGGERLVASDALNGFERADEGPGVLRLRGAAAPPAGRLRAGERRLVAWARLEGGAGDVTAGVDPAGGGR
jgi:hypothetical protein